MNVYREAHLKYSAGWNTAVTDRERGMLIDAQKRVPHPEDDQDWAEGYRRAIEYIEDNGKTPERYL